MRRFWTLFALVFATAIVASAGCKGFDTEATASGSDESGESAGISEQAEPDDEEEAPEIERGDTVETTPGTATLEKVPDVVEKALPGVVGIATTREMQQRAPRRFPFGPPPRGRAPSPERQGMGSGVIVSEDGLVLTNYHVVQQADEIEVTLANERTFEAEIVGTDAKTDLAVLRMTSPPDDLQPLQFGDSSQLRLGEGVIAIGNPFGLSSTVTMGIISAQGRGNVGIAEYEDFIQTDAAINPGNSGGALINLDGELIGINTAILSRTGASNGIGFAIPSNMASSIMKSLVADGEVRRGYLGVLIQTVEPELAESMGLPEDVEGVAISDVKSGSPADKAGLERHDVITAIEGNAVATANELRNEVAFARPGSTKTFTLLREGEEMELDVELGELPGGEGRGAPGAPGGGADAPNAIEGLEVVPLDEQVRARFDIPEQVEYGVLVAGVARGSIPARTGLRPGDIILEVNRRPVKTPSEFGKLVGDAKGDKVLLLVWHRGNTVFVPMPLE
jgi:serine protease Do